MSTHALGTPDMPRGLRLARNMDITSIAEGVDRMQQLDFLRSRGCEEVQGHLFAKAMPPEEMAAWMARPRTGSITTMAALRIPTSTCGSLFGATRFAVAARCVIVRASSCRPCVCNMTDSAD